MKYTLPIEYKARGLPSMNVLLERIDKVADEIIEQNLIMDMSEHKIIESITESELFIYTISRACPTSFLACC